MSCETNTITKSPSLGRGREVDDAGQQDLHGRILKRPAICQIVHSLHVGGAELLTANLARNLQTQFQFLIICLDELGPVGEQLRREGFEVTVLRRRHGIDLASMRKLAACCRRAEIQLIHAHQYTPFFYALASGMFYRRPPVLFTEHGRWFPDQPRIKRVWFNRLMLRSRDRVVGVGQSVRSALIENEAIPAHRVGVVYNGINLSQFAKGSYSSSGRTRLRRELGFCEEDFILIQVARLDALKDHMTALRALQRVVQQREKVKLLIVGEGDEYASICEVIRKQSLESQVKLVGLRHDVPQLLHSADAFLLTSISEGIPLTVIEAMATALPVVATRVGGLPEIVVEGETGFLANSGNDVDLATAILRLANDPVLCREMGNAGQRRAQSVFSDREMNTAYSKLYAEMLHG